MITFDSVDWRDRHLLFKKITFVSGTKILRPVPFAVISVVLAPVFGWRSAQVAHAVIAMLAGHVQPFEDHGACR